MGKRKQRTLAKVIARGMSEQACAAKFERLQNVFKEGGANPLRKLRDSMNHAGTHFNVSTPEFRTAVSGKVKRKGGSKMPTGYPSRNSQFGG